MWEIQGLEDPGLIKPIAKVMGKNRITKGMWFCDPP